MSFHHLLQNKQEHIFIQPIDQHFENNESIEEDKSTDSKENLNDLSLTDKCHNIDVKFYFSFDEEEDSNDVSTVDESDESDTLRDSLTNVNKKISINNFLNLNEEEVKVEISKIRNETMKESVMFQIQIQNKIKAINKYYEMQMKNYYNLINTASGSNLNKTNPVSSSTSTNY